MPRLSSSFVVLALGLIAFLEVQAAAGPKINSPTSLVQCQPAALSWTDASPPVYISAVPGTDTAANPLVQFATQSTPSGSLTWSAVNITQGTVLTLMINDATGVNNYSGQVTVKAGSDDCLNGATASAPKGSSSSGSSSSGSTGSTSTGSTGSTSGSSTSTASSAHGSTATTNTTSTPATSNHTTASTSSPSSTSSTGGSTSKSTTSGSAAMSSANTVVLGAAAAVAGVLMATGLF